MSDELEVVTRLVRATNEHDIDALVDCFAPGYVNETPAHPQRGFRGRDQVRENWTSIFAGVPDISARVVASIVESGAVWTEWELSGTRRDGAHHAMAGVIIFGVSRGRIASGPVLPRARGADERRRERRSAAGDAGTHPMILVAGGTGTLGREIVARLTSAGRDVRVLTRDAAHVAGTGVEVAIGDLRDPSTLTAAAKGASVVISAAHGLLGGRGAGPEEVDRQGNVNLLRAAVEAGVERFVLLSVLDARPDHSMSLHRAKYAAEQSLHASSLSWTVLRPSSYVETWIDIAGAKLALGGPAIVLGRAVNPINFVSVRDVAALAARALTDPTLRSQTIDVTGLDNLTMAQLAHHLGAHKVRHISRRSLRLLSHRSPAVRSSLCPADRAALVMDTTDMTADPSVRLARFPDIVWHGDRDCTAVSRCPWRRHQRRDRHRWRRHRLTAAE